MLAEGSHEEAIRLARSSLRVHRDHTPTYRVLAIAQMLSGQTAQACDTMAQMRAREPGLTVRKYLERYPGRHSPHASVYAEALQSAGLPD
jgi:hypothetical protein